jgi:signal transduction histidine kinase
MWRADHGRDEPAPPPDEGEYHHPLRRFHRHHHKRRGLRHYYGAHLHRRLFAWFGASIFLTAVLFTGMGHFFGGHKRPILLFLIPALVLWGAAGRVARRISRPLYDLVRVTREIGDGKLSARAALACGGIDELAILARAINDMAGRIERQLADQKQLLAEVSHELRTPLARIRLLIELARSGKQEPGTLDELEREAVEIDALVGELLASARLDFSALARRPLDGADLVRRAAERAALPPEALVIEPGDCRLEGDATLLGRALANLLDNARKHGGGGATLTLKPRPHSLLFEVEDRGAGFAPGEIERLTAAFARGERPRRQDGEPEGSLGLGLALVQRIARAHGGQLTFANRAEGGARVTLTVARRPADPPLA